MPAESFNSNDPPELSRRETNCHPYLPKNPKDAMYCTHCGAEVIAQDAAFCHKCGKPPNSSASPQIGTAAQAVKFPFTWVFWLLLICALLAWVSPLLQLFAGHEVKGQVVFGTAVWNGGLFAYVWKKRYNKGWLGFGLGALVTVTAISILIFCTTFVRVQTMLNQSPESAEIK